MENEQPRQMLNGQWRFRLDPEGAGEAEGWQLKPELFTKEIRVPGPIQGQDAGFATRCDGTRAPNSYQSFADLSQKYTVTPSECHCDAWYARDIDIPAISGGRRLWLVMEGVHPYATVWLDGARVGRHEDGPYEPFRVELTAAAKPGRASLAVRVEEDGRLLQGVVKYPYYSGITRDIYLETTDSVLLGDVRIKADIDTGAVEALAELEGDAAGWRVAVAVSDGTGGSWEADAACEGGQ
ncbi:MAG: hypothetical protein LBJ10_08005, partial [Clostridiales bacterium]|nr:hypothetical protein [Clostridiales bacterium]